MTISSMGVYSGKSRKKRKSSVNVNTGEILNNFLILLLFAIPISMIFGASLWRVRITSETQNLNKYVNKMQSDIHAFDREIGNYNIKIEKSCGRNIIGKVKELNMDLNYPQPSQIKRLNSPNEPKIQVDKIRSKKEVSLR